MGRWAQEKKKITVIMGRLSVRQWAHAYKKTTKKCRWLVKTETKLKIKATSIRQISNFKKGAIDCVTLVYLFTLFRNNCSKQNSAYFLVFATREGFIIIINCCFQTTILQLNASLLTHHEWQYKSSNPRQDDLRESVQRIQKNVRTSWKFLLTPLVKKDGG